MRIKKGMFLLAALCVTQWAVANRVVIENQSFHIIPIKYQTVHHNLNQSQRLSAPVEGILYPHGKIIVDTPLNGFDHAGVSVFQYKFDSSNTRWYNIPGEHYGFDSDRAVCWSGTNKQHAVGHIYLNKIVHGNSVSMECTRYTKQY